MTKTFYYWLPIFICLLCSRSLGAGDGLDLFQPGDPADVLAAGLKLPGLYAQHPDTDRPLSLLNHPAGLTLEVSNSTPWRETGGKSRRLATDSERALVLFHEKQQDPAFAFAASWRESEIAFDEDSSRWSQGGSSIEQEQVALAAKSGSLRFGYANTTVEQEGSLLTTLLRRAELRPGLGIGQLDWKQETDGYVAEIAQQSQQRTLGLTYARSQGSFAARTISKERRYGTQQQTDFSYYAPYYIWRHGGRTSMVLFEHSRAEMNGPVLYGLLPGGELAGYTDVKSFALVQSIAKPRSTTMYSVAYTRTEAELAGESGGFIFPGVFVSAYTMENVLRLDAYALRYGKERRRGKTAWRSSILTMYGIVDARVFATRSRSFDDVEIEIDDRWDNAKLWLVAPSVGLGYRHRGWSLDVALTAYAGLIDQEFTDYLPDDPDPSPSPGSGQDKKKKEHRQYPGLRWAVVLGREF